MKNTVYLIDYENISYKGLYGISEVKKDDEIIPIIISMNEAIGYKLVNYKESQYLIKLRNIQTEQTYHYTHYDNYKGILVSV